MLRVRTRYTHPKYYLNRHGFSGELYMARFFRRVIPEIIKIKIKNTWNTHTLHDIFESLPHFYHSIPFWLKLSFWTISSWVCMRSESTKTAPKTCDSLNISLRGCQACFFRTFPAKSVQLCSALSTPHCCRITHYNGMIGCGWDHKCSHSAPNPPWNEFRCLDRHFGRSRWRFRTRRVVAVRPTLSREL